MEARGGFLNGCQWHVNAFTLADSMSPDDCVFTTKPPLVLKNRWWEAPQARHCASGKFDPHDLPERKMAQGSTIL